MARKRKAQARVDPLDRGTVHTRARLDGDPLLDRHLDPRLARAGALIRSALEENLGLQGIDYAKKGNAGSQGSSRPSEPLFIESIAENRAWLRRWRLECGRLGLRADLAETFAVGTSYRQLALALGTSRLAVTVAVKAALTAYDDLRGVDPPRTKAPPMRGWADDEALASEAASDLPPAARRERRTGTHSFKFNGGR